MKFHYFFFFLITFTINLILFKKLPFYNLNNKRSTSVSFLKQNQDALLRLSVNKTTEVTAAILHQLTELAKVTFYFFYYFSQKVFFFFNFIN